MAKVVLSFVLAAFCGAVSTMSWMQKIAFTQGGKTVQDGLATDTSNCACSCTVAPAPERESQQA